MRKCRVALSLAKPRQNAEEILKTYELFIYGDIHYITKWFCKNVLQRHPSPGCEFNPFFSVFLLLSAYITGSFTLCAHQISIG
jgi:hypothetical protein